MLSQMGGAAVRTQNNPDETGRVKGPVLDIDKGVVAAYALSGRPQRFVCTVDIIGYLDHSIIIKDSDAAQELEGLVRLKRLVERQVRPFRLRVVTESGRRLGTAKDYLFDSTSHEIAKIHVRPGLLSRVLTHEFVIGRAQVVKMTEREIIVKHEVAEKSAEAVPAESAQ